jgi:hypothetical protein
MNNPGKITYNPVKIMNNPGKIMNNSGKIMDNPGKIMNNPGKITDDPGKILKAGKKEIFFPMYFVKYCFFPAAQSVSQHHWVSTKSAEKQYWRK